MSYNNNQYPYYAQNSYNQNQTSNTYSGAYEGAAPSSNQGSYYQQNTNYRTPNTTHYGSSPNQGYGMQQRSNSISDGQAAGSMTYMNSFGNMSSYNQGGNSTVPTSKATAMSYSAGAGRNSPATGYNAPRMAETTTASRTGNYTPSPGFSQSASRSTAQGTSSMSQYSLYATAQAAQTSPSNPNQSQQNFNRPYPSASQSAGTSATVQNQAPASGTTQRSSYASPTMATNPQLAQSHNKNSQTQPSHRRTPRAAAQAAPPRPRSTVQQQTYQAPVDRPPSADPSMVQSTMQQLANVPWQASAQPQQAQNEPSPVQPEKSTPSVPKPKNKGGRPVGSKNKPKDGQQPATAKKSNKSKKANAPATSAPTASTQASPSTNHAESDKDASTASSVAARMKALMQSDPELYAALVGSGQIKEPSVEELNASTTTAVAATQPASKAAPIARPSSSAKRKSSSFVNVTEKTTRNTQTAKDQSQKANAPTSVNGGLSPYASAPAQTNPLANQIVPAIPPQYQKQPDSPAHVPPPAAPTAAQHPVQSPAGEAQVSQQAPQADANANNQGGTFWPEDRRGGLALATKRFLEADPVNSGRTVNMNQIHQLLNQNPSYEQLCQILEGQGWQFQRSKFAQHLISAINSGNRQSGGSGPSGPPTANTSRPLVPPQSNVVRLADYHVAPYSPPLQNHGQSPVQAPSDVPPARSMSAAVPARNSPATSAPRFFDPTAQAQASPIAPPERMAPMKSSRSPSVAKPAGSSAVVTPIPEPRNKEEAARKRTFADFIDLTEQDEEDEAELELERDRKRRAMEQSENRFVEKPQQVAPLQQQNPHPGLTPWQAAAQRGDRFKNQPGMVGFTSARDALRNEVVVKPINHARAKRTSHYDPRTIARDFFLAKGEHPDLKPLNWHYEILFNTFKSVKIDSDLETFKWDLVDPGEPVRYPDDPAPSVRTEAGQHPNRNGTAQNQSSSMPARNDYNDDSDEDDYVGIMIPAQQRQRPQSQESGDNTMQDDGPSETAAEQDKRGGRRESQPGASASKKPETAAIPKSAVQVAIPSRPEQVIKEIRVPPVPTDFKYGADEPASPASLGSNSVARSGSIRKGRPPGKRGRGRPSRGSGLTRAESSISHQRGPAQSTPVSSSIPVNKSSPSQPAAASTNAIDNLIAGGVAARTDTPTPTKRPRGRPPRMSTPASSSFSVVVPSASVNQLLDKFGQPAKVNSSGKRIGRPPGSKNKVHSEESPSVKTNSDGTVKRKPGRPVGYRPPPRGGRGRGRVRAAISTRGRGRPYQKPTRMPSDGIGVVLPNVDMRRFPLSYAEPFVPPPVKDRKWGKDDKFHHHDASEYPNLNQYRTWKCKWHGCTSQLHNMKTLRKHVERIHLKSYNLDPDLTIECLWEACCRCSSEPTTTSDTTHEKYIEGALPPGRVFPTLDNLENHIKRTHLFEIERQMGGGPTVHPRPVSPSKYLNDRTTGLRVTPIAAAYGHAPPDPLLDLNDPAIPRENRQQFIKAYHKAHGNVSKKAKARAVLLSRQAWAEDEDRFNTAAEDRGTGHTTNDNRGPLAGKWKQVNMNGLRVEIPLSDRAKERLGVEGGLAAWRDRGEGESESEDGSESESDGDGSENGEREVAGLRVDDDDDDDDGVRMAAVLASPGRSGMMGQGMLAPKTIMATGVVPGTDEETDEDENEFYEVGETIQVRIGEQ